MRRFILASILCLAVVPAWAQMPLLGVSNNPSFGGPGNIATFTRWWGLRAYSSAQCTGSVRALTLRRASDNATANINILSSCDLDIASATTHCAATSCFVTEICDQVNSTTCAAAHDLVQATAANQPAFIFDCGDGKPCMRVTDTPQVLSAASTFTPATGVMSLISVGSHSGGTGSCNAVAIGGPGNRIVMTGATDIRRLTSTSGTIDIALPTVFSATVGVVGSGAGASVLNVNGTELTGTITASTSAGQPRMLAGLSQANCNVREGGFIDNVVLTGAQRQTLVSAARGYWNF